MHFRRKDSVIWNAHLEELPALREHLSQARPEAPAVLLVNGMPVEFVPMNGAPGWRAVGANRTAWNQLGYPVDLEIELAGPSASAAEPPAPARPRRIVVPIAVSRPTMPMTARREGLFVGVDVGGRPEKGFTLAFTEWRGGRMVRANFQTVPHRLALPPTDTLRPLVARGRMDALAQVTARCAAEVGGAFFAAVSSSGTIEGVFIDAPSAFSRNRAGHGRHCEKQYIPNVNYQHTPSIHRGDLHGGDWNWLVYGMIAFGAVLTKGDLTEARWREGLEHGLHLPTTALSPLVVRECFPTATVEHLRLRGRTREVEQAIATDDAATEQQLLRVYFRDGVRGNKPSNVLGDRTDALIAALSALPHANAAFEEQILSQARPNWSGGAEGQLAEGRVTLVA